MTRNLAFFALPALCLMGMPQYAQAQDDIWAETQTVQLNPQDPEATQVGELIYKGGIKVDPGEHEIGGISGLEWHDDALWAVSDDGRWMRIVPDEAGSELVDLTTMDIGRLRDLKGKELKKKESADAEAITRDPDGGWFVAFEWEHRIWRYQALDGPAAATDARSDTNSAVQLTLDAGANEGLETLAVGANIMIACAERGAQERPNCSLSSMGGSQQFKLAVPDSVAEHGGAPVDATCSVDDICYVLYRSYRSGKGNRAAIVEFSPNKEARILATLLPPLTLDNFEGLAFREHYGRRYLYLASDDNFNNCFKRTDDSCQDTLIMKFEIKQDEVPLPPIEAPPRVTGFQTTLVVLETSLGEITVALETERAPITAANFLRYADEDRFDGTVFYRAMVIEWGDQPNGLIQGGTQSDRQRILPGIQHEPTNLTGLTHTKGAISMAMGEPGTANGDFSIILGDQSGLDAQPASDDPRWKHGYAVFGYVTDGMDVVQAIHAAPTDPDAGEGSMKGQMLAQPVTIIDVRRVESGTQ